MVTTAEQEQVYRPYGNVRRLFDWLDGLEKPPMTVLVEGPGGTGKSRAIAEFHYEWAERFAHSRILVVRKYRADLREGWQRTFEDMVLWPGHPLLLEEGHGQGEHRSKYVFPNGSEIVLGHMEDPQRWFSSEWDCIFWNEAIECRIPEVWEKLARGLRKGTRPTQAPFRLLMGDTNPGPPRHFLNQACKEGRILRLTTTHADNPYLEPEALERLRNTTGVTRRRLYLGEWCDAEGRIIDTFDDQKHTVGEWQLPKMAYYVAGLDFGRKQALVVLGYPEGDAGKPGQGGTAYVVREVYRVDETHDWWAAKVRDIVQEFKPVRVIADSAEHRSIVFLNSRVPGNHVVKVAKTKHGTKTWGNATREHLRSQFAEGKLWLLDDPARLEGGPDARIVGAPRCLTDELLEWTYRAPTSGGTLPVDAEGDPDPSKADHAIDALIYALTWAWQKDYTPAPQDKGVPDYRMGAVLGHGDVHKRSMARWGASEDEVRAAAGGSTFDYTPPTAYRKRRI